MSEPIEIRKSLVLSTAHLRKETVETWNDNTAEGISSGVPIPHGYMHYAHSPDADGENFPEDMEPEVKEACRLAHKHDCTHLVYDMDGPVYDELEKFEW